MTAEANCLRTLHQLHLQMKGVADQLERGPRLLKARQQATSQKDQEVQNQKEKVTRLKVSADQKNLQLKTNESKIAGLKAKLNAASSNREFDAIRSQIEADTVANSVLEDEILDLFDQVENGKVALAKLEAELAASKAEEAKIAKDTAAAEPGLKQKQSELETFIAQAESPLPGEAKVTYRRLVQAHGAGAFSQVEGNMCTTCYVQLTAQSLLELKAGKIMFCRQCGRIMYFES